ncbi:MAG TPA: hypothetical protein VMV13_11660 [Candidatus Binataceae bacterium]|nr:hypothetical protein [Candidatus Binataceae bacterium]
MAELFSLMLKSASCKSDRVKPDHHIPERSPVVAAFSVRATAGRKPRSFSASPYRSSTRDSPSPRRRLETLWSFCRCAKYGFRFAKKSDTKKALGTNPPSKIHQHPEGE